MFSKNIFTICFILLVLCVYISLKFSLGLSSLSVSHVKMCSCVSSIFTFFYSQATHVTFLFIFLKFVFILVILALNEKEIFFSSTFRWEYFVK